MQDALSKENNPPSDEQRVASELVAERCYNLSCKISDLFFMSKEITKKHLEREDKILQECS